MAKLEEHLQLSRDLQQNVFLDAQTFVILTRLWTALAGTRGCDTLCTVERSMTESLRGIWTAHSKMKG